jgi:hypothetical protein
LIFNGRGHARSALEAATLFAETKATMEECSLAGAKDSHYAIFTGL